MERNSRIRDLVVLYWKGELSNTEKTEILSWAEEAPDNKKLLESFDNIEAAAQRALEFKNGKELIWEKITAEAPELKIRKLNSWPRIATIAAIFILCIGSFFVYQAIQSPKIVVDNDTINKTQQKLPEVLPADEGALLTLSDGTQIPIDSAGNILATQGKTIITKMDGGVVYRPAQNDEGVYLNTIQTFKGRKLTITLPDGTLVSLNVESKIQVPSRFTGPFREVILLEGEAYFEVKHDKSQPFHAKVAGQEIAVTGTKFNVKAYQNETEVKSTLFKGGIRIKAGKDRLEFDLKPGYELKYDSSFEKYQLIKTADLQAAEAWRKEYLKLDNTSIQDIMRVLRRHYDIDVIYQSKITESFNGELPTNLPLSSVIKILESTRGVRIKVNGKTLIISGS